MGSSAVCWEERRLDTHPTARVGALVFNVGRRFARPSCDDRSSRVEFGTRRQTVTANVGGVPVGSAHPIVVQSMTNTDTADAASTAEQVVALAQAGSQLVRVTVNNDEAAAAVPVMIRRVTEAGVDVPIIGDFHY